VKTSVTRVIVVIVNMCVPLVTFILVILKSDSLYIYVLAVSTQPYRLALPRL
jgi:hypothetical protein